MYGCPNCGAGMRYDIASTKMHCDYCGYDCAVDDHPKQREDAKREDYEVTIFTCPQCGGEISSTDNAATEFCSYCGASVVLEGRLVNEKKPALIIPFTRTKEDCKALYSRKADSAWCLPKEYKDPDKLEKFTGIYMPYWVYSVSQKGKPSLKGTRSSGNYTEYCNISFDVDHEYSWLPYDAASKFSDDLAEVINNFEKSDAREFSTAYMSGFYADSADVEENVYRPEAVTESCDLTMESVKKEFKGMSIDRPKDLDQQLDAHVTKTRGALFPVWFLTWRDRDRVSYAVVNGDTGEVAADLPVSIPKFILFSLLMAIPLAILLNLDLIPSIMPSTTLAIFIIVGVLAMIQNQSIVNTYIVRENHLRDKGLFSARLKKKGAEGSSADELIESGDTMWEKIKRVVASLGLTAVILIFSFIYGFGTASLGVAGKLVPFIGLIMSVIMVVQVFRSIGKGSAAASATLQADGDVRKALGTARILIDSFVLAAAVVYASVLMIIKPVNDLHYYIAAMLIFAGIIFGYIGILRRYNLACTRPIPEYHERGKQ